MKRKALIVGATGATGRALVALLNDNPLYEQIVLLHYRETGMTDGRKIVEYVHSFEDLLSFRLANIDDVFCCIGTTMKKAGSKEIFSRVDKDYVIELGKWSKIQLLSSFHVISYLGADKSSSVFYNKIKGEMEEELIQLNLHSLYIYHPPLLKAKRKEFRFGEFLGSIVLTLLSPIMFGNLKKHKPLAVEKMAASMMANAMHPEKGVHFVSSEMMQERVVVGVWSTKHEARSTEHEAQ